MNRFHPQYNFFQKYAAFPFNINFVTSFFCSYLLHEGKVSVSRYSRQFLVAALYESYAAEENNQVRMYIIIKCQGC